MYARQVDRVLKAGTRQKAEELIERALVSLKEREGFRDAIVMFDTEIDEFCIYTTTLTVWDTLEEAVIMGTPQLKQEISEIEKVPPIVHVYEIYQSKA